MYKKILISTTETAFRFCSFILLLMIVLLPMRAGANPTLYARRMQAHLLIGDTQAALTEAQSALKDYPNEPIVYEWSIRCLSNAGEVDQMLALWEQFHSFFSELALGQDLLEEMCWGILKKGKEATGLGSQLICLIGAALTQDMRAVPFLLEGMHHTNAHIRAISVELGAHYGDHPLREEICRLFKEEKIPDVRVSIVKAIGKLQLDTLLPELMQSIANPKTAESEKLVSIEVIVQLREYIDKEQLEMLANSRRSGLRQLACEVIAFCDLEEQSSLLVPLMQDTQSEVCASALKAWGFLRKKATDEIKRMACAHSDPIVGITAAWVWLLDNPKEAESGMIKWLEHPQAHVRALAAAAVADAGPYGTALSKKILKNTQDPFVQINLALALVRQREESTLACSILEQALQNSQEKWMLNEDGLFNPIEKSNLSHNPAIANFPEVVNQTVRLELLNLLAILESPKALDSIKSFLKQRKWGVTGLAAETLLGEGDDTAIDLVRELLKDPDHEIRLEAALVLASWGRDAAATTTLLEVYPKADRQLQLKILESLGRIGDRSTIPFLLNCLKDPSLIIRMVTASILIQTLNH